MKDVFSLPHYVTTIDEFMKTGDVRTKYFKELYSATTTIQVVRICDTERLVEITASVEVPKDRFRQLD